MGGERGGAGDEGGEEGRGGEEGWGKRVRGEGVREGRGKREKIDVLKPIEARAGSYAGPPPDNPS